MSPPRLRILLVDDHPPIVRAVSRLLAFEFHVVGTVGSAEELPNAVQLLQPDVIILDLNLPTVGGVEACRLVTQNHPGARIIIFTAMDDPEARRRAFDAGATAFVNKLAIDSELLPALRGLQANH